MMLDESNVQCKPCASLKTRSSRVQSLPSFCFVCAGRSERGDSCRFKGKYRYLLSGIWKSDNVNIQDYGRCNTVQMDPVSEGSTG